MHVSTGFSTMGYAAAAPADAGGQPRGAVSLDDITAPKVGAVHAHHQLRPAEDVGGAVRHVQREVEVQGFAGQAPRRAAGDLRDAVLRPAQQLPVGAVQQLQLAVGRAAAGDLHEQRDSILQRLSRSLCTTASVVVLPPPPVCDSRLDCDKMLWSDRIEILCPTT